MPRWLSGKESAFQGEDMGSIPGSGRTPGEGNGNPLQYSCLENPQGQRSLAGYSLWSCKESDVTKPLNHHHHHSKVDFNIAYYESLISQSHGCSGFP